MVNFRLKFLSIFILFIFYISHVASVSPASSSAITVDLFLEWINSNGVIRNSDIPIVPRNAYEGSPAGANIVRFRLVCRARVPLGVSPPSLLWTLDGIRLTPNEYGFSEFGTNQSIASDGVSEQVLFSWVTVTVMRISSLPSQTRTFQGTQWSSNNYQSQPNVGHFTCSAGDASRTRFVNAQLSAGIVVRSFQSQPALLDQPFLAGCFALGTFAQEGHHVRLSKDGTHSTPNWMADQFCSEKPGLDSHAALMHCSSVKLLAAGNYQCHIGSEKSLGTSYQRFSVTVMSPLNLVLSVQYKDPNRLMSGDDVTITCNVDRATEVPRATDLQWLRDSELLTASSDSQPASTSRLPRRNYRIEHEPNSKLSKLVLLNVSIASRGNYTCRSESSAAVFAKEIEIFVIEPARFRSREMAFAKVSARVGDSVELPCAVEGDPSPAVTWFFAAADAQANTYPTQRLEPLFWNDSSSLPDSDARSWQRARRIAREAGRSLGDWTQPQQRLWLLSNHSLYVLNVPRALRGQYMCVANNIDLDASRRPKPPLDTPPHSTSIYHKMTLDLFVPAHHRSSALLQRVPLGTKSVQLTCYSFGDGAFTVEWRSRYANGTLSASPISVPAAAASGRAPLARTVWATASARENCSTALRDPLAADVSVELLQLDEEASFAAGVERLRRAALLDAVPDDRCVATSLFVAEATREANGTYACIASNEPPSGSGPGSKRPRSAIANFSLLVIEPPATVSDVVTSVFKQNQSALVLFAPPFDGNDPIRNYTLSYRPIRTTGWNEASRIVLSPTGQLISTDPVSEHLRAGPADNATITLPPRTDGRLGVWLVHLQAHQHYLLRVVAYNSLGASPIPDDSAVCKFLSASAPPSEAPSEISAVGWNQTVLKVSWREPSPTSFNGQFKSFRIHYQKMPRAGDSVAIGGARFVDMELENTRAFGSGSTAAHERMTITYPLGGLNESSEYEVWVQLITTEGASPESERSRAYTLEDVPSEPPNEVTCVPMAGGTILRIRFKPPSRYAHSQMIANYSVYYRELALPNAALAQLNPSLGSGSAESVSARLLLEYDDQNESASRVSSEKALASSEGINLNNVKPYTSYVIQVLSITAFGLGARSEPLLCLTAAASKPGTPRELQLVQTGRHSLLIIWEPPEPSNAPISHYRVQITEKLSSQGITALYYTTSVPRYLHQLSADTKYTNLELSVTVAAATDNSTVGSECEPKSIKFSSNFDRVTPRIVSRPQVVSVHSNGKAWLPCEHYPSSATVTWTHRSASMSNTQTLQNGSLIIDQAMASHEGVYICELHSMSTTGGAADHLSRLEHRVQVLGVNPPDAPVVVDPLRSTGSGATGLADATSARFASSSGSSALQLEWLSSSTHGSPLTGFELSCTAERSASAYQYSVLPASLVDEMRKWNESRSELEGCSHNVRLEATARTHRFRALRCGANYRFGVSAMSARGVSPPGVAFLRGSSLGSSSRWDNLLKAHLYQPQSQTGVVKLLNLEQFATIRDESACPVTRLSLRLVHPSSSLQRSRRRRAAAAAAGESTHSLDSQWLFISLLGIDPLEDELVKKRAITMDCTPDPKEGHGFYNLSWISLVTSNRSLYCNLPANSKSQLVLYGLTPGRTFTIEIGVFDSVGNSYSIHYPLQVYSAEPPTLPPMLLAGISDPPPSEINSTAIYLAVAFLFVLVITISACGFTFCLLRHFHLHREKSRTPESGSSASSRARERSTVGGTQKKRRPYAWRRLLLLGRGSSKKMDNDLEMHESAAANGGDRDAGYNVRATRRGENDTVIANAAATTATSRAGAESSRQRTSQPPTHHYEAIPDLPDHPALDEKDSAPRPSSRRRRHSIGGMTTSSDTSTVGDLANVNVNGAAIVYGLGPAARSGRSRRPLMLRQVSHEVQICPQRVADAPANALSGNDSAMVRSYAASTDSDGRINPYATFNYTGGRRGGRDKYDAAERTTSRNYSGRAQQSDLRTADTSGSAADAQRPLAVRASLGLTRPPAPQRLASTSSTGTTTVGDRVQLEIARRRNNKRSAPPPPVRAMAQSPETTVSSNQEELQQIYESGKVNRILLPPVEFEPEHSPPSSIEPPPAIGATIGIETSDTTDPGIRSFSQQPPLPDEQRNATCEIALFAPQGESSIDPKRERPAARSKTRTAASEQQTSSGRDKAEVERWAAEQRELTASMITGQSGVPQVIAAAHFQPESTANALNMAAAAMPTALLAQAPQYYCMPCVYGDRAAAAPLQIPVPTAFSIAPYALSPAAPAGMVASFYAGTDRPAASVSHYDPYYTTYVAHEPVTLALQQVALVAQPQQPPPPAPGSSHLPRRFPRRVSQSAADQQIETAATGGSGEQQQPHRLDRFVSQPAGNYGAQVPPSRVAGANHSRSRSRDREGPGLESATLVNLSQSARVPAPRTGVFRAPLHSVSGVEGRSGASLRALPLETCSVVNSVAPVDAAASSPPAGGATNQQGTGHQRELTETVAAIARLAASAASGDSKHYGDSFTVV